MTLEQIITRIAAEIGFSTINDREILVSTINDAGQEIFEMEDWPGSLQEVILKVFPDATIACPAFVNYIRAIRMHTSYDKIVLTDQAPRYVYIAWPSDYDNWRVKTKSALMCDITNAAPIVLKIASIEATPVSVSITGATLNSNNITEVVVMDELEKTTTNAFTSIKSITKGIQNQYNIGIYDADDTLLAVLYNDLFGTSYQIVDISTYPNLDETESGEYLADVLFKPIYQPMIESGDEYQLKGYEQAVIYKTLEMLHHGDTNSSQKAVDYFKKCQQILLSLYQNAVRSTSKKLIVAPRPDIISKSRRYAKY